MSETARDCQENLKQRIISSVAIDKPTDHGVEENNKGSTEGGNEEPHLGLGWILSGEIGAGAADEVKQGQCTQTHSSVNLAGAQVVESIDDDHAGGPTSIEELVRDAHQVGDLASANADSRASHEGRDGSQWNEVDDPASADEANKGDDGLTDNG